MQPNASSFFYRITKGADGSDKLERVTFNDFDEALLTELNSTVRAFVDMENSNVFQRIAAGTAAKRVFSAKSYRRLCMTKEGYCRSVFDRDPSTVNSYVEAANAYEEIGGIDAKVQPNSVNQLDMLAGVKPGFRSVIWAESAERNNGQPPPAHLIYLVAEGAKAWIEKKKKEKVSGQPELPCSTLDEAIAFAAHCQGMRRTTPEHWAKIREFLLTLPPQQVQQPVQIQKKRARKLKAVPDVKGQALMFEEHLVPKAP